MLKNIYIKVEVQFVKYRDLFGAENVVFRAPLKKFPLLY